MPDERLNIAAVPAMALQHFGPQIAFKTCSGPTD